MTATKNLSLCIATPTRGALSIGAEHNIATRQLVAKLEKHASALEFVDQTGHVFTDPAAYLASIGGITDAGRLNVDEDVVRARSRMVRAFREKSTADLLLFVDDDVSFTPMTVVRMIGLSMRFNVGVLCALYTRKYFNEEALVRHVTWALKQLEVLDHQNVPEVVSAQVRARAILDHPLRFAFAQQDFAAYNRTERPKAHMLHPWLLEVDGAGFGLALLRRDAIARMTKHYEAELWFRDERMPKRTVALFQLILDPQHRELLSEDHSFCSRWRAMGEKVYGFIGPDAVRHTGSQTFEADISCLVGEEYAATLAKIGVPENKEA